MGDHADNAATLAADLAGVLDEIGCTADDAAWLPLSGWKLADTIVRYRRLRRGDAEAFPRAGFSHVPSEVTRAATIAVLRDREGPR